MRTIHKFTFKFEDTVTLEMPKGAVIVRVAKGDCPDYGHGLLWAIVDTEKPMERRTLFCRETGHVLPETRSRYLGTFNHGPFFWHVLEPMQMATR